MGETTRKVLINSGVGLAIALGVSISGGILHAESAVDFCRILCDGFFVAAVLLLGYGGLTWTYNGGVMDGLGFSVKTIFDRMHKDYDQRRETFMEYRAKREAKATSPKYALLAGTIHLVISLVVFLAYQLIA